MCVCVCVHGYTIATLQEFSSCNSSTRIIRRVDLPEIKKMLKMCIRCASRRSVLVSNMPPEECFECKQSAADSICGKVKKKTKKRSVVKSYQPIMTFSNIWTVGEQCRGNNNNNNILIQSLSKKVYKFPPVIGIMIYLFVY